jgi:hypothetical protein
MKNAIVLLVNLLARLAILLGTGGTRAVLAENILLRQQLLAQLSILGGFWKKCASTVRRFLRKNAVIDLPEAPKGL